MARALPRRPSAAPARSLLAAAFRAAEVGTVAIGAAPAIVESRRPDRDFLP